MSNNASTTASTTASTPYISTARYMPISGEDYPLTEKQKKLMALAHDLGKHKFAPRAAQLDRDAQFPFENYKDMKDSGLLALCVPEAHGGLGADYATYAMVSAEIGRWCGATALTFNMHVCTMMWSGLLSEDLDMTPEQRALHRVHQKAHFARVDASGAEVITVALRRVKMRGAFGKGRPYVEIDMWQHVGPYGAAGHDVELPRFIV